MFAQIIRAASAVAALALSAGVALAQEFPQTFTHRYGTTIIPERPERVVSLSYQNHDNLLALGVVPVGLRYWYGDYPFGVWPWAQDALGDGEPAVLTGDINIEQIAALQPDVIEALWSGITQEEYDLLSQIAPVIPPEAQYDDYSTPWDVIARTTGRIVGQEAKANEMVDAIETRVADIRAAHPEWEGMTSAVAYYWNDAPGAYASDDIRPQFLSTLGFVTPAAIDEADVNGFATTLSNEDISALDVDLLIWVVDDNLPDVVAIPLRRTLDAHKEGREVYADQLMSSAFSHASLLSLPYVLDHLVPMIELAVDGDPATVVPESAAAGLVD